MPTIKVLPHAEYCPEGREIVAASGESVCEALLENGIRSTRVRDELCVHDLPRGRARGLRRSANPTKRGETCSTVPGGSSRLRACPVRRSWRETT